MRLLHGVLINAALFDADSTIFSASSAKPGIIIHSRHTQSCKL
jgi:hypothetical protein